MGNGFPHILLNEPSPIDMPDSGNCLKQGVCHGDAESLRLLWTKDALDELNNSPLSLVPTIPKVESVYRVVLSSKLPYIQIILAASSSFTFPWPKSVNFAHTSAVHFFESCLIVLNH